jgi:hypothetical protein
MLQRMLLLEFTQPPKCPDPTKATDFNIAQDLKKDSNTFRENDEVHAKSNAPTRVGQHFQAKIGAG